MNLEAVPHLIFQHLGLTLGSVGAAAATGIPLGIVLTRLPRVAPTAMGLINIIQTLPSLALLGFLIPVMGIGMPPALLALFLYALLPIVRSTYTGIRTIPADLIEVAEALGLRPLERLRHVEIPLALPHILAGLRTSTVINVGTATLAAYIGAGGLGEPIFRGIAMVDSRLILTGAIPAALLALALDALFQMAERKFISKGLRDE